MKRFSLLLGVCLSVLPFSTRSSEPAGPGWLHLPPPPAVTIVSGSSELSAPQNLASAGQGAMAPLGGEPVIAEYITPEITALAQGLQNDPKQIFDYVRNKIRYVHYFGSKKGAQVTLLERSGNDFDQCALLVALLRAADANNPAASYTVSYEFGCMKIPYQATSGPDLRKWLGLTLVETSSPENWQEVANLLQGMNYFRGYPKLTQNYVLFQEITVPASFIFHRVWVKFYDGVTTYYLDPALKTSTMIPGLDVSAAMQLNVGNLLSGVAQGATIITDLNSVQYVKDLNYTQLKTTLGNYTANLLQDLTSPAHKNLTAEEVIGGYRIVETETTDLPTSLAFPVFDGVINIVGGSGSVNLPKQAWDNIPSAYLSKIRLEVDDINHTYDLPELRGRKLSLTFVSSQARISLDDAVPADQSGTTGSGTTANMRTTILHPFGVWNYSTQSIDADGRYDQPDNGLNYQRAALGYVVVYGFDDPNERVSKHQEKLEAYLRQGLAASSPQVATETLAIMGLSWVQQSYLAVSSLGAQTDVLTFFHHRGGRSGAETGNQLGFFVDLALNYDASVWRAGDPFNAANPVQKFFEAGNYLASAFEHGVLEQWQTNASASTIKCLQVANSRGKKLILATKDNWSAVQSYLNAEPLADRYTTTQRDALWARLAADSVLLMPSVTNNPVGANWKGYGYVDRWVSGGLTSFGMIISGGYAGGFAGTQIAVSPVLPSYEYFTSPTIFDLTPPSLPSVFSWDPVNMADGSFTLVLATSS